MRSLSTHRRARGSPAADCALMGAHHPSPLSMRPLFVLALALVFAAPAFAQFAIGGQVGDLFEIRGVGVGQGRRWGGAVFGLLTRPLLQGLDVVTRRH